MMNVSKIIRQCGRGSGHKEIYRAFSTKPQPHPNESFLSGSSASYMEQMYNIYSTNPNAVNPSLKAYFENMDAGVEPGKAFQAFPGLQSDLSTPSVVRSSAGVSEFGNLMNLIRAYQTRGHEVASLDPLGIEKTPVVPDLDYKTYGFTEADLDRKFSLNPDITTMYSGILGQDSFTLRELLDVLNTSYASTVGVEYMHINDREQCNFIREMFEVPGGVKSNLTVDDKKQILERLGFSVLFEQFLATKWNTAKRFGLEGCESFIPGFKALIDQSTLLGVENVVIGMPHRGRLNVIANVVRKDLYKIFMQFKGLNVDTEEATKALETSYAVSGDVKYHLGMSFARKYPDGREVNLSLAANPSHLEAVNPVVLGKSKAMQYFSNDEKGQHTMPVLIHGDAAFCGQGVVYETMGMCQLPNYGTGGTIHIVVNNQIGYTTIPKDGRSSRYSTDLGKAFNAPVFHVNADDPEAVHGVFKAAAKYRQKYLHDVVIDVIGYRKNGHNEMDQPLFTQPEMYQVIKKTPDVFTKYSKHCIENGVCNDGHIAEVKNMILDIFEDEFAKSSKPHSPEEQAALDFEWVDSKWVGEKEIGSFSPRQPTKVDKETLQSLGETIFTPPEDFTPHRSLKKIVKDKKQMCATGEGIDWGCAELLAYGSLLLEGKHVRISGQDVQRGTFSHRHAVLHDQQNYKEWCGLNSLSEKMKPIGDEPIAKFSAANSHLSEYGVMGFELGYSLEDPNALVIWEAQFGDFNNGAQIIIDQFVSCGETKWNRQSGLVLLLPHGYDGGGPEHSSCRIERFLQLSDEDPDVIPENIGKEQSMAIQNNNWQVCNATTPAQFFHLLRRQVHRGFRKPLVVASPKSMLKDDQVKSSLEDFYGDKAYFHRLLFEVNPKVNATPDEKIRKVIFCVGKIYYELAQKRDENEQVDVAIIRIEQITPFPFDRVQEVYQKYPNAELVFCQEEPKNQGPWYFCDDRIYTSIREVKKARGEDVDNQPELRCEFVGRPTMASPAVGYGAVNAKQQEMIIEKALA